MRDGGKNRGRTDELMEPRVGEKTEERERNERRRRRRRRSAHARGRDALNNNATALCSISEWFNLFMLLIIASLTNPSTPL